MPSVLVAFASKHGATAEIAEAVAETLRDAGLAVDTIDAGEIRKLDHYDAVVLGSAVYMKRWRGDAKHFLHHHRAALAQRPFWVFSSGPAGEPTEDEADWAEPPRIARQVEALGARGHVVFGGRLPEDGWISRTVAENTPPEYRDRRDWDAIRDWAQHIAVQVKSEVPASP